ncbi:putative serine protease HhoB [Andreprevotia sp. IGB-42]|uniref:S1C family serine protease n=1 Tax=Andreprevotia sp. IGB-42 TaxID=2497473 RepID=UPI0013597669|nr:serine protease [Andreprevotia sp. IGB-42]KAF0812194.1 putative serine protease HhoB [Andreprevotia sp. IGB-42]
MRHPFRSPAWAFVLLALLLTCVGLQPARAAGQEAQQVFHRYKDAVVQIRIIDKRSGNRVSLGTGFAVDDQGHVVSNFHVISAVAYHPEWNRIEAVSAGGTVTPLAVVGFDVVHDLSLLRSKTPFATHLGINLAQPEKGTPLYAFGIPLDLDFTIVQGLYNGLLEKSLHEQIHFTGAINPGMSGGPAVDEAGLVVGVNVATSGNGVGFLVPAKFVTSLLKQKQGAALTTAAQMLALMSKQLLADQQANVTRLLQQPITTSVVGNYQTPKDWSDLFKCWGGDEHGSDKLFINVGIACNAQSSIYLSEDHQTGQIAYSRSFIQSKGLSDGQFARLYGRALSKDPDLPDAAKDDVGNFECQSGFVKQKDGLPLKTVFCLRAYRKLPGLYDMVLSTATLDNEQTGLINRLILGGVSYDNAVRISKKYLGAISWKH